MWKLKFISINNIIFSVSALALLTMLVFAYLYLIKPIFIPETEHFLLQTKEVHIKKDLFTEIVAELEKRPQKAQRALEKWHPDMFRF